MPNKKVMQAADEHRRQMLPEAKRVYRKHRANIPDLIHQLTGPTQADHDYAYDLLRQMGDNVVPELLAALDDSTLDPLAADEAISLLGLSGDERACEPIWQFLQTNQDDPERVTSAVLSLAGLGDDRALPYLRDGLESRDDEIVANAASGMIFLGQLEDIPRLRAVPRQHRANREIRTAIANAILTILDETDRRTFERTMDNIQYSFADRDLWSDIWTILDESFGQGRPTVH